MHEVADIIKLDMISRFIGALLGLVCAESHTCPTAHVSTEYVNIMNSVCGRNVRQQWKPAGNSMLRRDIRQFKAAAVGFFSAYQKS